jgi:hypothetical protein
MKNAPLYYSETPDRWVILKITDGTDVRYKVFGTWGGSYLYGQSWQMNSGIKSVAEKDDYFYFTGHSGSVYRCYKDSYGYFSYGMSVLSNIIENSKDFATITEMPGDTNWFELDYK